MAKKKAIKRSALTATQREQVQRVKERLAGDDYWKKELARARRHARWVVEQLTYMMNAAMNDEAHWSGPRLRRLAERARALNEFARVVGYNRNSRMTEAEQDAAWDRWHVRFARALRVTRRKVKR